MKSCIYLQLIRFIWLTRDQFLFSQLCRLPGRKFLGALLRCFKTAVKIIILIWDHWVFPKHMLEKRWRQCLELKIPNTWKSRWALKALWFLYELGMVQWTCGIAQATSGPFLPSVNLRPYFLRGLLKWSQRAEELFASILSLVWSEELTDLSKRWTVEQGWRSSWLIQHSVQNTKPKDKCRSCHLALQGKVPSEKQSCFYRADWQPKETPDILIRQEATMIKDGILHSHAGGPQEPCICSWEEARGQSGTWDIQPLQQTLWPTGESGTDEFERFVQISLPKRKDDQFEAKGWG